MKLNAGTYLNKGKYRIVKVLGQGSFGITYLATVNIVGNLGSIVSSAKVAIKEFFMREVNGRNEETVTTGSNKGIFYNYKRRFIKEAKTLSRLNHPNIVRVLDLFEENNTAYYVMEYLEGGNLDKLIAARNGLSVSEATRLIRQIASALGYLHSQKMLHLDLKPANVMLDSKGDAVLIDFGLTKEFDENGIPETSTTIGHGTPGYSPLEQSNYRSGHGFPVTMDIYALGATLYKMLSGKRPPEASEILNEGVGILNSASIPGPDIAEAIAKAMSPLKSKRFQSVDDFIIALKSPSNNYHQQTLTFPANTISYLIIMKNQAVIYYYRGTIYKDLNGAFLSCADRPMSVSEIRTIFDRHFTRCEDLSFGEFIEEYGETICNSHSAYASFLKEDDYYRVISANSCRVARVMRENSYIATYLSRQLLENEKSENSSSDIGCSLNYDNSELGFIYGEGVCEIYSDFTTLKAYSSYDTGKRFTVKSSENLKMALLGGILTQHTILSGKGPELLVLDIMPFDIYFGPQWGKVVPTKIDAGSTIPTKKSNSFDFAGTDFILVKIGNRIHPIHLIDTFGYAPKEIECTIEIGPSLNDIKFVVTDKSTGRSKSFAIVTLFGDDWKEPEWT